MDSVEVLDDEEGADPTEEEIIEYARFLDIDPETEPHLMWIAKEGVGAPVPHPWKACTEDDDVFYFNFETSESIWDHPCDSHYKELLAEERKKHANGTANVPQPSTGSLGVSGDPMPVPDEDMDNSKSFVSEAVDSDDSKQSGSSSVGSGVGADNSRGGGVGGGDVDDDESKSFVSEAVSVESSPKASPTAASSTMVRPTSDVPLSVSEKTASAIAASKDAKQSCSTEGAVSRPTLQDQAAMWKSMSGGDAISTPRSSRSSRSASSAGSRNPPKREASKSPESRHSSRSPSSASSNSRGGVVDERLETAPYSPRSSRNSFDDGPPQETLASPKSPGSADSREKDTVASELNEICQSIKETPLAKFVDMKDDKLQSVFGQDSASNLESCEMQAPSACDSVPQASPKSSTQASPQGSDRARPVLDHSGYSARSSNPSEISEDFHSDWGILSPPGSARSGRFQTGGLDVQNSLEISASVDTRSLDTDLSKSLGLLSGPDKHAVRKERLNSMLHGRSSKTWHSLEEDVRALADALDKMAFIRSKQKEYLNIIKLDF